MQLTLLELTQDILSSLDSDEVNSINDTTESRQIAQVIRTAYFNIIARANLPEHKKLFQLTASGDNLKPVLMIKPATVSTIEWIKYEKSSIAEDSYQYVTILPLEQFLNRTQGLGTDAVDVDSMTLNGITYYYKNDTQPSSCAIVDDLYVIFDSFDFAMDATLQTSKTLCFGQTIPAFTLTDAFVPDMDEQQVPLLLNEAKSLAFFELKQIPHQQSVIESRRQWRTLQRTKSLAERPNYFDALPDFGRRC